MRLLLIAGLAACSPYAVHATTPPLAPFGPGPGEAAQVCVVRPSAWAAGVTFVVHDNQQLVGATRGPSYFCYVAAPGRHEIVSDTFDSTDTPGRASGVLAPNQRYWLYQDHDNNLGSITSKLAWIDERQARDMVSSCEYKVVTATPAHEQVPPAVPYAPAI